MADENKRVDVQDEDGFGQVLSLLAQRKDLSPPLFLAALSLTNLLGIVQYLNALKGQPFSNSANQGNYEKQALTSTLLSLLSSEGQESNKDTLASTLINALGSSSSGKKMDPASLVALASSLAGQMEKAPATQAQYAADQPGQAKGQAEVRELNTRRG